MLILGIDTSCDDTAAAVVENGNKIISNVVSSQNEIHQRYGGIVPELASRRHIEMIMPIVNEAMNQAGVEISNISAIATCEGPGLIGSLLIGVCFAKALSFAKKIPMVAINHLEGHIFSIFLEAEPAFPFLALIVSGGHTSLYQINDVSEYIEIGRTRDDAAGEAYDKVAKLLGLGYPGGPAVDMLAAQGNPHTVAFPKTLLRDSLDFSFSGLKTAVLNYIKQHPESKKEDVAASFQAAVIEILTKRTIEVAKAKKLTRIVLSGGVSANSLLREKMVKSASCENIEVFLPSRELCTDNAAMIAAAGYHYFIKGNTVDFDLNPKAYLPLGPTNG